MEANFPKMAYLGYRGIELEKARNEMAGESSQFFFAKIERLHRLCALQLQNRQSVAIELQCERGRKGPQLMHTQADDHPDVLRHEVATPPVWRCR